MSPVRVNITPATGLDGDEQYETVPVISTGSGVGVGATVGVGAGVAVDALIVMSPLLAIGTIETEL